MAGADKDESDEEKKRKEEWNRNAPNMSGHVYRCACCLEKCPPFAPDNRTMIPVCASCWLKIGSNNRLLIVSFFRNSHALENLSNSIHTYVDRQGMVGGHFGVKKNSEN